MTIAFEKEHLDTSIAQNDLMLTIFGAVAQEESRCIAANVTTGLRRRYPHGEDEDHRPLRLPIQRWGGRHPDHGQRLVDLYHSGKRMCDICREYDIAHPLFDKWVKQADNSSPFHEKDDRTPEQEELIRLRKELEQLRMENDILKQAALILGRE